MSDTDEKIEFFNSTFNTLLNYVRDNHPDEIDEAYEFFWEEDEPEDMLGGTALGIAFINFEDWLMCDYKRKATGESFADLYIAKKAPDARSLSLLQAMRSSHLSVYQIKALADGQCTVEDLIVGGRMTLSLPPKLREGDIFGGRIFMWEGAALMGRSVYPFNERLLERVRMFFDKGLQRFHKKTPGGTVQDMLKEEAYYMNVVWLNCLYTRNEKK